MTSERLAARGYKAGDVIQGGLADCWILSALSIIACSPELLLNLFVSDEYAEQGIYVVQVQTANGTFAKRLMLQ